MCFTTCTFMITGDTLPVLLKMCHWVTGYFPGQFHPPPPPPADKFFSLYANHVKYGSGDCNV